MVLWTWEDALGILRLILKRMKLGISVLWFFTCPSHIDYQAVVTVSEALMGIDAQVHKPLFACEYILILGHKEISRTIRLC